MPRLLCDENGVLVESGTIARLTKYQANTGFYKANIRQIHE